MKAIIDTVDGLKLRYENALFFDNDTFLFVNRVGEFDIKLEKLRSITDLIESEPDGWTHSFTFIESQRNGYKALTGETSYGGSGYVGLKKAEQNQFIWLLHLDWINNPLSIKFDNEAVVVTTDLLYPDQLIIRIPITDPESLHFMRSHN